MKGKTLKSSPTDETIHYASSISRDFRTDVCVPAVTHVLESDCRWDGINMQRIAGDHDRRIVIRGKVKKRVQKKVYPA